ncbi:MAG: AMP-dependent synthetase [Alphaproteobacteria bacterium]|nr:MAG: AMP-dependent synthetase [Alphaproteobacteria bacterium]
MDYAAVRNLPEMFFAQAARLGDKPFLWHKEGGAYRSTSWHGAAIAINRLARGLKALGVKPGERVVIVAENRPEWLISDHAIMAAGGISVPAFTTNTTADHKHVLTHSGAVGAIVSSKAIARRLLPAALDAPELRFLVCMEDLELGQRPAVKILGWEHALARGDAAPDDIEATVAGLKREDTACFIYTSGTGGTPKAVMLSHGAMISNCMGAYRLLLDIGLGDEVFLSFLPLSHAYEHTAGQFFPISIGAQIYYAESVDRLIDNMAEARPTIVTAVPRLYEVMHQRIVRGIEKTGGMKRRLFDTALDLGRRKYEAPRSLGLGQRLVDLAAEVLVRRKVRQRFGGRLKAFVSGGAALHYDIGLFFTALGVRILQGYGQTEAAPVVSCNLPSRIKLRSVGPTLEGVEVKIAEDGEILVRGELLMQGYWRDPTATEAALRDGWLHTGDIGMLDEDGYLHITDRKKDIIVFSGGDNVSPARIESLLILQPEITQAMVHGDKRPHLVALLVPEEEFLRRWARERGKTADLAALADDAELHRALGAAIDRVNAMLSPIERIRRYAVARAPFTVDNGQMTPSLKIRRHKIREAYGEALARLYERGG